MIGDNPRLYKSISINGRGNISIGKNFTLFSEDCSVNPLNQGLRSSLYTYNKDSSIIIGDNVGMSSVCIWAKQLVKIGDRSHVGAGCVILDNDSHSLSPEVRTQTDREAICNKDDAADAHSSPIIIEDDVWIGTRCIILKGVIIGSKSIIGAGSVVTNSIPSNCIAAGNPCRVIRKL